MQAFATNPEPVVGGVGGVKGEWREIAFSLSISPLREILYMQSPDLYCIEIHHGEIIELAKKVSHILWNGKLATFFQFRILKSSQKDTLCELYL